jgi:hypothetical protein
VDCNAKFWCNFEECGRRGTAALCASGNVPTALGSQCSRIQGTATAAISETSAPPLFQSERYGAPLQYSFSLPNGTYTVNLHFA